MAFLKSDIPARVSWREELIEKATPSGPATRGDGPTADIADGTTAGRSIMVAEDRQVRYIGDGGSSAVRRSRDRSVMSSRRRIVRPSIVAALLLIGLPAPGAVVHARPDTDAGLAATVVPIQVQSGHVYVDVEINGEGPFHFLFDTGASNILTPKMAERLGLAVRANVEATGTGGAQAGGSTTVGSVRLGDAMLSSQTFYVLDLPPGTSDDAPVDGLIGFEWLDRFLTRLDYASGKLTFYTAKEARYTGAATPARLSFRGRTPQIDGKVDGIFGRFSIDTGSAGSLTLSAPFVADHHLAKHYNAGARMMSARGIGGPVYSLPARAELLDLGTATAKRPVTFLSQQRTGTSARKDTAGNIGFGVLRQFTIIFDYPRRQIYFEPNANWASLISPIAPACDSNEATRHSRSRSWWREARPARQACRWATASSLSTQPRPSASLWTRCAAC
ncbi:hypothetical protein TQ38_029535 (plasmid) [Novosphingobium sp. P6W]|nr:hypothetical protein TQ38_029535 [Novosphingobium sp. P6W]